MRLRSSFSDTEKCGHLKSQNFVFLSVFDFSEEVFDFSGELPSHGNNRLRESLRHKRQLPVFSHKKL